MSTDTDRAFLQTINWAKVGMMVSILAPHINDSENENCIFCGEHPDSKGWPPWRVYFGNGKYVVCIECAEFHGK